MSDPRPTDDHTREPPDAPAAESTADGGPAVEPATSEPAEAESAVDDAGAGGEGTSDDGSLAAAEHQVEVDLEVLARERDEYLDALRRLQADFDNFRKRMMRQQAESSERAAEQLVNELLPVLDAIDLADQHGQADSIAPVAGPLRDILEKAGLERIDPVGATFNPEEHEAVAHEAGEGGNDGPTVVTLMRAGYRWKGRLLRAAMVGVRG